VRCCRPAKQCLWLGTGGHCRRCRDAVANADTESYAKSDGYACCMCAVSNTHAHTYIYPNTNSYSYSHSYGDCYSNAYCHS
jgi:hypothetical protein